VRIRPALIGLLLVAAAVLVAACGGGSGETAPTGSGSGSGKPALTVSAAASLKDAFTAFGKQFADASPRFSFAGSDELAAQIEQGVKPDVYAAANTKLPQLLYAKGLVDKPVVFAGNRLVLAVPAGQTKVTSPADVEKPGVKLAIGSASAPIGSYTRSVLDKLPPHRSRAILHNVRSEEPDVAGIVGKLTQGAVDAGFVYISDVRGAAGKLKAIELPAQLQPSVAYGAAVVKGAKHPQQARAFIDGLLSGAGARALQHAGFEAPPSR
jgi:molybdate transport system substrate-binding protein